MVARRLPLLAAGALAAVLLPPAPAPAAVRYRTVDVTWRTIDTDIRPGPRQIDRYRSTGRPFLRGVVTTDGPDKAAGEALVLVSFRDARGTWKGRFRIKKDYVLTTATFQDLEFDGFGFVESGTGHYRRLLGTNVLSLSGGGRCTTTACDLTLRIKGRVRF